MMNTFTTYLQFSPYYVTDPRMTDSDLAKMEDKIDNLSPSMRDVLFDKGPAEAIGAIVEQHRLTTAQGEDIARLIRDIILGDVFLGDIKVALQNKLGVNEMIAAQITDIIGKQIFAPILDELKTMHKQKFAYRINQAPPQPIPSSPTPAPIPTTSSNQQTASPTLPPRVAPPRPIAPPVQPAATTAPIKPLPPTQPVSPPAYTRPPVITNAQPQQPKSAIIKGQPMQQNNNHDQRIVNLRER